MTERPLLISTQSATPFQTGFNSTPSTSATNAHAVIPKPFEEDYTIKCICDFDEDDGNTVLCETCETWQHIECFYPGRVAEASKEDFEHSCAECNPRNNLDRKHAVAHQRDRQARTSTDSSDKKSKRPPTKSHKKKPKPSDLQVNGLGDHDGRRNGSPQEHHPKKPKGHRSNQSISSQNKRSPPCISRPQSHGHPPSPAHTPPDLPSDFQVHSYSDHFQTLYDNDHAVETVDANKFAKLEVSNSASAWLQDSEKLRVDTGITHAEDAFQHLTIYNVNLLKWPDLAVITRTETKFDGVSLRWKSLTTPSKLTEMGRIAELNGEIGFQKDYCDDPLNRWQEYVHPKPFIFFHPRLPLFIDTRKEGSLCRYARRSCRPNVVLDTFIANKSEYHFWLTSDRPLDANEQITVPWDFRFPLHSRSRFLHLLNLGDEEVASFDNTEITEEEYTQLANLIDVVLSDHGGCACDLGNNCSFARFHRNYHGRSHNQSNGNKPKKGRKPKQSHISPTSTGHATNSRAASEGQDQIDDDDRRSASGSIRSKPTSRDLTPLHSVGESNGIMTETSDREKRKLAMAEESFRKMEDKQGQPARKKKRVSDGSTTNNSGTPTTPHPTSKSRQKSLAARASISQTQNNANGARVRQYADASTSRRQSDSPFSAISPTAAANSPEGCGPTTYRSRQNSAGPPGLYTNASTQTDKITNAWYSSSCQSSPVSRPIIPLSKRLLKNRLNLRLQKQAMQAVPGIDGQTSTSSPPMSVDAEPLNGEDHSHPESPTDARGRHGSVESSTPSLDLAGSVDVTMADAPAILLANPVKPPPLFSAAPLPGTYPLAGKKSPDLQVQLPSTPSFIIANISGTLSGSVTPLSATGSIAQSPFGTPHFPGPFPLAAVNGVAHASPIKTTKKMSLSDYKAKRSMKPDTSRPSTGSSPTLAPAVLKPSLSTIEEIKASGNLEGSAIISSPTLEKKHDPMNFTISNPESAVKSSSPSATLNGTL